LPDQRKACQPAPKRDPRSGAQRAASETRASALLSTRLRGGFDRRGFSHPENLRDDGIVQSEPAERGTTRRTVYITLVRSRLNRDQPFDEVNTTSYDYQDFFGKQTHVNEMPPLV
jgi:hypothetical protein